MSCDLCRTFQGKKSSCPCIVHWTFSPISFSQHSVVSSVQSQPPRCSVRSNTPLRGTTTEKQGAGQAFTQTQGSRSTPLSAATRISDVGAPAPPAYRPQQLARSWLTRWPRHPNTQNNQRQVPLHNPPLPDLKRYAIKHIATSIKKFSSPSPYSEVLLWIHKFLLAP